MGRKECPRCGMHTMKEPEGQNAISNEDKKTFICSDCGINESRYDFFKAKNRINEIPKEQIELRKKFRERLGLDD